MEQKVTGERTMITVIKRNGLREEFNPVKLLNSLKLAGAPNPERILEEVTSQIKGKGEVTSSEISDSVQLMMLNLISEDFKWHDAARNYLLFSIYKQAWGKEVVKSINSGSLTLSEAYRRGLRDWFNQGLNQGLWSLDAAKFYEKHLDELMNKLDPSRDLLLTYNGVRTLMSRYLMKRLDGSFFETPQYMWMRIAMGVAYSEVKYGNDPIKWVEKFYDLVSQLKFLPNSPTMFNALTKLGELSACFVIPVDDCLSKDSNRDNPNCFFGIMDAAKLAALLFQAGAGVGYQFGELRPEGDVVKSTSGVASGPLSFMRLFDTLVDVIKQGGKRRGAQMGMLFWWHPDIEKFITSKTGRLKDVQLQNFNISVTIDDYFMTKALRGEDVYLLNPRECTCLYQTWGQEFIKCYEECVSKVKAGLVKVWRRVNAGELWSKIVESAWDSGDPGLWNRDVANMKIEYVNDVVSEKYRVINGTNPCGEVALYPFESCNLGSINLTKYINGNSIDWVSLANDIMLAVRFLDDVIDSNQHPHEYLDRANKASRRIGLGINGWADVLVSLDIPYDSPKAIALADVVMGFVARVAVRASVELAKEKGPFPLWPSSKWRSGFLPWRVHDERVSKMLEVKGVSSDVEEYLEILKLGYGELGGLPNKAEEYLAKLRATDDELIKDASTVGVRNGALISIAPEGSRSLIAGVNSSIEPIFAIAYVRNLSIGKLIEYNYTALRKLKDSNALDNETTSKVLESGMLPSNHVMHPVLKTANEIHWRWHVFMQVTFAKWSDSGVSKTINMPSNATKEDVNGAYRLAWALGAFGITVYRDKSKAVQVIYTGVEGKGKAQSTESKAIKVTVKAINLNRDIEENKLAEIGETDDPACRTGVCG
ncbi:adenosylcobalamin-dependent ribonucleoside-diphosphate reductase [Caldivirga maquilingensis]|uniref:Vitamin B12-dependent ribonucleotide reductase n=1 Tax=Caldivirga maquilingensis (strain ATCC 700844 / DSM 13496 / JCM 10307 / IC-167) TaxID=397948 RepID=A8MCH3_CALMQ|nr:adenosylcobalamin-dependent ribonucleoside-diphosphate reductase [Caldivirga maquilingensis]ABW01479.1 ribonucleoside-diphosphate reductase, adenosylcobalamin-dependent [Caldivirga maquilingensis IC-167]